MKGHNGIQGNEGSDALARLEVNKQHPAPLNLEIPDKFDIIGAKLTSLTQATAYRGILEQKQSELRRTTKKNIQLTHTAIQWVTGKLDFLFWQPPPLWQILAKEHVSLE